MIWLEDIAFDCCTEEDETDINDTTNLDCATLDSIDDDDCPEDADDDTIWVEDSALERFTEHETAIDDAT